MDYHLCILGVLKNICNVILKKGITNSEIAKTCIILAK